MEYRDTKHMRQHAKHLIGLGYWHAGAAIIKRADWLDGLID